MLSREEVLLSSARWDAAWLILKVLILAFGFVARLIFHSFDIFALGSESAHVFQLLRLRVVGIITGPNQMTLFTYGLAMDLVTVIGTNFGNGRITVLRMEAQENAFAVTIIKIFVSTKRIMETNSTCGIVVH